MAPFPWRRLIRIAGIGLAAGLLVLAAGMAIERVVLGPDDATARARAAEDVRASFDRLARELREMSAALTDPSVIRAASDDDRAAARQLFAVADSLVARNAGADPAVTVYDAEGTPLAWAGRASELPPERLLGGDAWFIARGALGLRLVYATPVDDGTRLGVVTVERPIGAGSGITGASGPLSMPTRYGEMAIDPSPGGAVGATEFEVVSPSGEPLLAARLDDADLDRTRARWRQASSSLALITLALTLVVLAGPLLDWRNHVRRRGAYAVALLLIGGLVVAARAALRLASPADWSGAPIFSAADYASQRLRPLLSSPFDFLMTALAAGALVGLAMFALEAYRLSRWNRRRSPFTLPLSAGYIGAQLAAGAALAAVLVVHQALVRDTIANTTLDLLQFSVRPLDEPRLSLQVGLVLGHASALTIAVLLLRGAMVPWRPRSDWGWRVATWACWVMPLFAWQLYRGMPLSRQLPLLAAAAGAVAFTVFATRLKARYRHGSQAFRLLLLSLGLLVPAFVFYPDTVQLATEAKEQLVETRYAPQALHQRKNLYEQLTDSLAQIDELADLGALLTSQPGGANESPTDRAFAVWQSTPLATEPITSSIELYGRDDRLVGRFAFNLPEDPAATPTSDENTCDWAVYEEVAPFFADDRRILHAGRQVCRSDGPPLGSIVVHAMLDEENLPFISSRSPYVELLRPADPTRGEGLRGRDVEYASYGWSRTPIYSTGATAWLLPDDVFARIEESREPFWARLFRGPDEYDVYLQNDRGGIYALGFQVTSALGHLVNLAEVTVLAIGTYVLLLAGGALFAVVARRGTTAPALLREVRASFYRKLFLAFVAAVMLPVVALALVTRNFVAGEIRRNIEQEAVRTAAAAGRVVEDLVAPRAIAEGVDVDDNLMVWVSRLIDQDVNIFSGPRLVATSERNLFASGLLPTRTPGEVYHALELRNEAATVVREQVASNEYLVAATPLTVRRLDGILTVPLASRQQEIDEEIATLDRRVLLAALLFIMAGAGLGYSMAERISDPVNRLTRATRRIARGDLDARIVARSSDELRRLVEDFNSMAADLQRQRRELERTHRLEAWAEMARQVAHEIKNPLTPIQLNAEHLRRVHADRGEPLGPVLQECVATILTQVKLLRQIASDFSNFASSPTARLADVDVRELLQEIVTPYRGALAGRIGVEVEIPGTLPVVHVDRALISRSLTNIIENALHAMPGSGTLRIAAHPDDGRVRIRVTDTGAGMDAEALARAFEPYFSTKASGTGLGLPIARRNVELSGGTVRVESERDRGTTVEVALPIAAAPDPS